jgi:hypothetical protein
VAGAERPFTGVATVGAFVVGEGLWFGGAELGPPLADEVGAVTSTVSCVLATVSVTQVLYAHGSTGPAG